MTSSLTGLNEAVSDSAWADDIAISVGSGKSDGPGATGGHFVGNPAPWVGPQITQGPILRAPSVHVLGIDESLAFGKLLRALASLRSCRLRGFGARNGPS
jgi:hypothetical protein